MGWEYSIHDLVWKQGFSNHFSTWKSCPFHHERLQNLGEPGSGRRDWLFVARCDKNWKVWGDSGIVEEGKKEKRMMTWRLTGVSTFKHFSEYGPYLPFPFAISLGFWKGKICLSLFQVFVIMTQCCAWSQQCTHCIPMLYSRGGVTVHGNVLNKTASTQFLDFQR